MRWPEGEDPCVVDQNIDMAISDLDRLLRHGARARSVAKVRRNKIPSPSRGADFLDRLFAALRIAANDQNVDAELCQLIGHGPANAAGSPRNKCCGIHL